MIIFEIHALPKAQKQTQFCKGHAFDPSKIDRESVIWQIRPYAPKEPLQGPLNIDITFYLPIPKGTSNVRKKQMINNILYHVKRPDVDNLSYLVVNAMKDVMYEDDSQIVDLNIHKRYGENPKTVVKILELQYAVD